MGNSARAALDAGLDPVIVVLGQEAEKLQRELAGLNVRTVFNPEFAQEQGGSLRKGLDALASRTGAALVLYADQPFVTAGLIETIVRAHRRTFAPVCVPVFEGQYGNPVLFDRTIFSELRAVSGDDGIGGLLDKYADALVSLP